MADYYRNKDAWPARDEGVPLTDVKGEKHPANVKRRTASIDSDSDLEGGMERPEWGKKTEYILAMVGFCVGLGNLWRFPYICMRNGGGAFLIPFFIMLLVCGLPLFFLEVTVGQFMAKSVYHVFAFCPAIQGVGVAANVLGFISSFYYPMVLIWSLVFLAHSFQDPLPWTQCGQWWNTDNCRTTTGAALSLAANTSSNGTTADISGGMQTNGTLNMTSYNVSSTKMAASEEFWVYGVLQVSSGFGVPGGLVWQICVGLIVACVIVLAGTIRGPKSVGKVVYVTATLPYILITVLLIRGALLPGAAKGVIYYIKPDFSQLLTSRPWIEACIQVFYSLGPCWGGLHTMASFNKFNNNCMRDSIFLAIFCEGTSVFAGFAIFTYLGHMSETINVPIESFAKSGPGLAFVVYPEALSYLPLPQLWAVVFFLMLVTLAMDSQFMCVETVCTTVIDLWPRTMRRHEVAMKTSYMAFITLLGLIFCCRGGIYYFTIIDWYYSALTLFFIGFVECLAVAWVYGDERFCDDIALMLGRRPPYIFNIMWRFVVPLMLAMVIATTLSSYQPPEVFGYKYTSAQQGLGWCIAVSSMVPIFACAAYKLAKAEGSLSMRFKQTCTPSQDWRPADPSLQQDYLENSKHQDMCNLGQACFKGCK